MDVSIYLNPCKKKSTNFTEGKIGQNIIEYNEDSFPEINKNSIALISIPENRGNNENVNKKPYFFDDDLYHLHWKKNWNFEIYNLGVIIPGQTINDSFIALSEVMSFLIKKGCLPIIVGGTQDLTLSMYNAYEKLEQTINTCAIDFRLDLGDIEKDATKDGFLSHLLIKRPCYLFNHANIGLQAPHVNSKEIELFNKLYFDSCSLGEFNNNFKKAEPHLRNTDLISFDFNSIRKSDANYFENNINGFYAEQACQISHYAGISDKLSSIGFFNYDMEFASTEANAIISELIWYFINGYSLRKGDYPIGNKKNYTKFSVYLQKVNEKIVFYKSDKSTRWWMEVPHPPSEGRKYDRHYLVPCEKEDYDNAMKNEIPNLWWKTYQKLQ